MSAALYQERTLMIIVALLTEDLHLIIQLAATIRAVLRLAVLDYYSTVQL